MRKTTLNNSSITLKNVADYLSKTINEKDELCLALLPELKRGNPSIKDLHNQAQAIKAFSEYLLMAIRTNSPHYLK